ncbi:SDR family NAD(P)-dependent oxidoreductase, partial [Mammaliicoccus vitulinus]|uniref:SDR family NAD(P)-dependent oxidoreductase n=1 Tax=Mammaliicoccus vitulinus TaxID=71237 RepID=UPI00248D28E7
MTKVLDKVTIITGGASGMGESHVRRFVKEGAKVVFTDINVEAGEKLSAELGENALFVKHDVTDEAGWQEVVEKTEAAFGPVDVLVNN